VSPNENDYIRLYTLLTIVINAKYHRLQFLVSDDFSLDAGLVRKYVVEIYLAKEIR